MKKSVIQINSEKSLGNTQSTRHHENDVLKIDLGESIKMTKEEEKQIILDAVCDYILSCNEKEATKFIKEITDIIVESCVRTMV